MGSWLAGSFHQIKTDFLKRFDPRYWLVNFPRPMMAALTTPASESLSVDCIFYRRDDLAGLIWESHDSVDHPLLAYETIKDYRGTRLSFRWRSSDTMMPLDAVNGPTLTLQGRDAGGNPRSWYVRLWNYATGTGHDALIELDFDDLAGGFSLPGEADPVWAGSLDRLFISLVGADFDGAPEPLPAPRTAQLMLEEIRCDGPGSTLRIGDAFVPPHRLRMATGYDDIYNLAPARIVRNTLQLGYNGVINHYVGMSHYFALQWSAAGQRFIVQDGDQPLNEPCLSWHRELSRQAADYDFEIIYSLSYELFDEHAPEEWKQRAFDGNPALTGWSPPSTLVSPANPAAIDYLKRVAVAFISLGTEGGRRAHFQVGEPWWWVGPDHVPCIYDAAATSLYRQETGLHVPEVRDVRVTPTDAQERYLSWCGSKLGLSTLALRDRVRAFEPSARCHLLFYAPQVMQAGTSSHLLNFPAEWRHPAFDVLQLEDYDFVIEGNRHATERAVRAVDDLLGYPRQNQHYFSGFVLSADQPDLWLLIEEAALSAQARGVADTFLWAYPQIMRDGFTYFSEEGDSAVESFHDVLFPLELGLGASGGPVYQTQVATTASGYEQRNSAWAQARLHYEAGLGVRSEEDLVVLLSFFRARRGRAAAFRFRDPLDHASGEGRVIRATDQLLGTGDGIRTSFQLVKNYGGGEPRRITRPVPGSLKVALNGTQVENGWELGSGGIIEFDVAPAVGARVSAGFVFDVPVRFASDELSISLATFLAGEIPSVPLIEVRE
jgi:uncharacterized protein (TIGR02217 family)